MEDFCQCLAAEGGDQSRANSCEICGWERHWDWVPSEYFGLALSISFHDLFVTMFFSSILNDIIVAIDIVGN
jgi:hypothetical protein